MLVWADENRPKESWPSPGHLPVELLDAVSDLYKSLSERWTGQRIWDAPQLDEVVNTLSGMRSHKALLAPSVVAGNRAQELGD